MCGLYLHPFSIAVGFLFARDLLKKKGDGRLWKIIVGTHFLVSEPSKNLRTDPVSNAVEKKKGTSPILGLAADCLSGSSNSPNFGNTLADEGHRF